MKKLGSVISSQQFNKQTLKTLFRISNEMKAAVESGDKIQKMLEGKLLCVLFYEASTRTKLSFEAAMIKLGGRVMGTENARVFSSAAKGESLEDTIRTVNGYGVDVIVLRYDKEGGAERAKKFSEAPIINAGDGPGLHPTQGLLDLFTISQKFGKIEGLNIVMMGDLTNGRTVRSLSYFLAKHFPKNKIIFASPEHVKMRQDIKDYLNKYNVEWHETNDLMSVIREADVVYQTRIQSERFKDKDQVIFQQVKRESQKFIIGPDQLAAMKKTAVIMHPLPRVDEIQYIIDKDPRAIYFEQAQNGLYVRMALLKMILVGY